MGYYKDLGPDGNPPPDQGEEYDKFAPYAVAVSPDGNSLAVAGTHENCTQASAYVGYVDCLSGDLKTQPLIRTNWALFPPPEVPFRVPPF